MQPKIPLSVKLNLAVLTIISMGLILVVTIAFSLDVEVQINGMNKQRILGGWGIGIGMVAMVILNAVVDFYSRFWQMYQKTKYNTDFYGHPAKILIEGLRDKVLVTVPLSSSEKAKFHGEVDALEKILTEKIPGALGKIHDIMQVYDLHRDYASVHKSAASYTNYYHSATLKIREIQRKENLKADDIDDELADIIEAWDKLEEKYM